MMKCEKEHNFAITALGSSYVDYKKCYKCKKRDGLKEREIVDRGMKSYL